MKKNFHIPVSKVKLSLLFVVLVWGDAPAPEELCHMPLLVPLFNVLNHFCFDDFVS